MPIIDTSLQKESRDRYLTYALSVVSSRAIPDVRDGLKPVQRRILYDMFKNLGLTPTSGHRKSAAVVGGVLARFHPHGDSACYEAMVRMAQDFSMRYPLVDGQGNFGSLDGDSAAAYRYTEVRLQPLALEVVGEIKEETVAFRDNFDSTQIEPVVLPSRVPNLLINGAVGIAVGLATSIPPHNLKDAVKALVTLIDDPKVTDGRLATLVKGPDFPTACSILNTKKELAEIYKSGRGAIRMRSDWKVEEQARGKRAIIITSIPYAQDKSQLVEKIANLIIARKVPQLVDVRDESTEQVRIVAELSSGADPELAMAYLFKHTPLQANYNVNLTALVPTDDEHRQKPVLLSLRQYLQHFIDFRLQVVKRKLEFERKNLLERLHILEGFIKIYDVLDQVIKLVRQSEGRQDAAKKLMKKFKLSEIQAFAIVDMRIYQLSKTSIAEIKAEFDAKTKRANEIAKILKSKKKIANIIKSDLEQLAQTYGDKRRSQIVKDHVEEEFDEQAYVVKEEVYALVTKDGWVKRIRLTNDLGNTRIREGDSILQAHALSTLDSVAFFTNFGNLYVLKVTDFPASSGYGSPIQKILKFKDGEAIAASFAILGGEGSSIQQKDLFVEQSKQIEDGNKVVLVTEKGLGFALTIDGLANIKKSGKRSIRIKQGDALAAVCLHNSNVAIFTRKGSALAIKAKEIPLRENPGVGVILMGVRAGDRVVGACSYKRESSINLNLSSGKPKKIKSSEVLKGRRALKGRKVIGRGEIKGVS